jgi:hypothetical protein
MAVMTEYQEMVSRLFVIGRYAFSAWPWSLGTMGWIIPPRMQHRIAIRLAETRA